MPHQFYDFLRYGWFYTQNSKWILDLKTASQTPCKLDSEALTSDAR